MKSRFQPDEDSALGPPPRLIDPEGFDVSEQRFAASLEENPVQPRTGFVPEGAEDSRPALPVDGQPGAAAPGAETAAETHSETGVDDTPDPDSWRREVAARVNHYRGKRPRAPRYPSLQLKFESAELSTAPAPISRPTETCTRGHLAIRMEVEPASDPFAVQLPQDSSTAAPPDSATKILAFPRSSLTPPVIVDELAEPVFDRPRILEVPEVLPPPPALGGILIEATEEPEDERRPGFELPLQSAPLSRRILAGMTDGLGVMAAFAAFAYIFFRITATVPPPREGVGLGAGLLIALWAAYQYLLLVHTGSTPGLKLAKLELSRFDGSAVPRRLRRWRVLASVLSGLSLALGYVWCFMDEDELCWHDRITHTYMAPKAGKSVPAPTSNR
ncbi:MAG: RDD family protein [Terriglobales bacterium]